MISFHINFRRFRSKIKGMLNEKVTLKELNVSIDDNYHKNGNQNTEIPYFCSNKRQFESFCLD